MTIERAKMIIKNAIAAYEDELRIQDYGTEEEMKDTLLHEFDMSQREYEECSNFTDDTGAGKRNLKDLSPLDTVYILEIKTTILEGTCDGEDHDRIVDSEDMRVFTDLRNALDAINKWRPYDNNYRIIKTFDDNYSFIAIGHRKTWFYSVKSDEMTVIKMTELRMTSKTLE